MLKWVVVAIVAMGVALWMVAARAQQPDPADALIGEWQTVATTQKHLVEAMRALIDARRNEHEKAEADLKWLRDNYVPKP